MAHEMQANDHMFSGEGIRPWHGLGTILPGMATAAEALEAAKLNFTVLQGEAAYIIPERQDGDRIIAEEVRTVRNRKANFRSDDGGFLGMVSDGYSILQNVDAFSFFDSIVEEGAAVYETAGSMFGGKVIYITAKIPGLIRVGSGDDVLENYVLLRNTHDGSGAVTAKLINTRVVCNNTLTAALREDGQQVSMRHSASLHERIKEAHVAMDVANKRILEIQSFGNDALNVKMSEPQAQAFYMDAMGMKFGTNKEGEDKLPRIISEMMMLREAGKVTAESRGTLWGDFNVITEFLGGDNPAYGRTYRQQARSENTTAENKLESLIDGKSAEQAMRAMALAQTYLREGVPAARPKVSKMLAKALATV
jgi:phage/plasmid-like protein (TIGR03299 family)